MKFLHELFLGDRRPCFPTWRTSPGSVRANLADQTEAKSHAFVRVNSIHWLSTIPLFPPSLSLSLSRLHFSLPSPPHPTSLSFFFSFLHILSPTAALRCCFFRTTHDRSNRWARDNSPLDTFRRPQNISRGVAAGWSVPWRDSPELRQPILRFCTGTYALPTVIPSIELHFRINLSKHPRTTDNDRLSSLETSAGRRRRSPNQRNNFSIRRRFAFISIELISLDTRFPAIETGELRLPDDEKNRGAALTRFEGETNREEGVLRGSRQIWSGKRACVRGEAQLADVYRV